ncbi:carboxypeptidase-like regulatory domain-containing protein [Humisphaera borealis]|uniref:Carboxypeptidase regulatory-like domain-containing protein n=1 Tax=Humisphaera borealis TaxID=2807512 RepID=A0A7M2WRB1_9BACT|nr:carboxypeptidase-like regulatory domain-containing protein [Humisphaera borealis]QOV87682.1 carboxypeptidase regulatory-like domain-containing protein [Humisphaera borealis]
MNVPSVRGRVVDNASASVAGATVSLRDWSGEDVAVTVTRNDGTFRVSERSKLVEVAAVGLLMWVPDPRFTVVVTSGGKAVPTTQVSGGLRFDGKGPPRSGIDVGVLKLP